MLIFDGRYAEVLVGVFHEFEGVLRSSRGDLLELLNTDATGNYIFYDVRSGLYTVTETNLYGYLDVKDKDLDNPNYIAVAIGRGSPLNFTNNDFVDELPRKVAGVVLEDSTNNGHGDEGMSGVVVELRSDNTVKTLVGTTLTDSNGYFEFGDVLAGKDVAAEQTTPGYVDVRDSDGGDPNWIEIDVTKNDSLNNEFIDELPSETPTMSSATSDAPSVEPSGSTVPALSSPTSVPTFSSLPSA